ncbi:MAG: hypothetical protein H7Y88_13535 [Phycisphaerales bacterium]|nr:hypothetical protein [Phycisphaerales bacterium]
MDTNRLHQFMLGALVMASAVIGLWFLRSWRRSGERLFLVFAVAFWLLAVNWAMLAFWRVPGDLDGGDGTASDESRVVMYVIRLAAFLCIIAGVVLKNRRTGGRA